MVFTVPEKENKTWKYKPLDLQYVILLLLLTYYVLPLWSALCKAHWEQMLCTNEFMNCGINPTLFGSMRWSNSEISVCAEVKENSPIYFTLQEKKISPALEREDVEWESLFIPEKRARKRYSFWTPQHWSRICSSAYKSYYNTMENKLHHFHKLQLYGREGELKNYKRCPR